jgi:DeoR/GlpR family transcriptional regulator of sugar metabolism
MTGEERLNQIVSLIDARRFVSVKALSEEFDVSEVTIRRDLQRLQDEGRLVRTFGGGVSLRTGMGPEQGVGSAVLPTGSLIDQVDVLIATSLDPQTDRALMDRAGKRGLAVIGESIGTPGMKTVVSVDNFRAGLALGKWAGQYARAHFHSRANLLDLTYALSNTRARSQGFVTGLREVLPGAHITLSIDAQSRMQTSYQLTHDALSVHPEINLIFAINDSTAWGAMRACRERGINPEELLVVTFGLEGDTLKNALREANGYCRAGLAMFPEIVGPVCIEAAIAALNRRPLAAELITPHAVLTGETLERLYRLTPGGWEIRRDALAAQLELPLEIDRKLPRSDMALPKRIGFVVSFGEHEWYSNLGECMREYAAALGIELRIADATQIFKDDVMLRQREIAKTAALQVKPGDVVLIDGSEITTCLAEELSAVQDVTVITNSVPVFQILRANPDVTLISTGGSLRRSSEILIGPTTEAALRSVRADKLFLAATGVSLGFGVSHTNVAEVGVKQAMLRAVREVILLADHTRFGHESVSQIAPVTAIHKIITDEALPAGVRLEYSKLGIEMILAKPVQ